ncbi:trehalose-phosphatase [Mumia zhuanghuii]|uniref:Trehalose 6-phosphate phosphatase n=1 Tax=Mumia zhuanghuii TaxID=2585211 RepID=A0A5C4MPV6_9ACTN|nr:trehalose-phosphatase [Mumia zhuanghuii]TNC46204.1 trehalose-phosphatase [Mumia zhuanghuii]TNC46379.1 trehalose-phosphatase [Mumia zhuanghuii]
MSLPAVLEPHPRTDAGAAALASLLLEPEHAMLAFDFDGTLAPIVDDPEHAHASERSVAAMDRIGPCVGKIAVVTGRPVRTALRLGRFAEREGLSDLTILGQYGAERWDAETGEASEPPPHEAVDVIRGKIPALLARLGMAEARLEDKGRALVVHTRGLVDPLRAQQLLEEPLTALAREHGLSAEPGRYVVEVRDPSIDKGAALRGLVAETGTRTIVYAGDDLGDLPAYAVLDGMRARGEAEVVLIAVASDEQRALMPRADLVVHGPEELASWLERLADALGC